LGLIQALLLVVVLVWVFPPLEPIKSYREASQWIRQEIGENETHMGYVFPRYAHRKKEGFGYYGDVLVTVLETPAEVERFLRKRPESVVLIEERGVDGIFSENEERWRSRVVREMWIGRNRYLVVR
jgi:hypothetical protein